MQSVTVQSSRVSREMSFPRVKVPPPLKMPDAVVKKLPIPLPMFYYFELIREVLANKGQKGQTEPN